MRKEAEVRVETGQGAYGSQLPIFDQIAHGYLKELSSHRKSIHARACLEYLDGKVKVDESWRLRRNIILAAEDSETQTEAPQSLRREVREFMKLLELDHIPELKLYRDVATAILRIDATLHLSRISGTHKPATNTQVYH
jgi:hypothetical protein